MGDGSGALSAQNGGPLKTRFVRCLRPLLVQWLNENMPRILENAIREEIATRGLVPEIGQISEITQISPIGSLGGCRSGRFF